MAQVFGRTCFRPIVTAITQASQAQPTTAQLHSLSQVHVHSVACNLRIWHARTHRSHLKDTAQGGRALCSAAQADVRQDSRRKIVFLGTPEVFTCVRWCMLYMPPGLSPSGMFSQVAADVLFKLFRTARLPESTFRVLQQMDCTSLLSTAASPAVSTAG